MEQLGTLIGPLLFRAAIFCFGIALFVAFLRSAREVAVIYTLRRIGLPIGAEMVDRYIRAGRGGISFNIVYSFTDGLNKRSYTRTQSVHQKNYTRWRKGTPSKIRFLENDPTISCLSEDIAYSFVWLNMAIIVPIFPVFFFGWTPLPSLFFIWIAAFTVNLWLLTHKSDR